MSMEQTPLSLPEALAAYDFGGAVAGALRYGHGHINDTLAVYTQRPNGDARRFILQRINTHVFTDPVGLMENILGVTEYLRKIIQANGGDADRETLTVVRTKEGLPVAKTTDGSVWRCYLFVEDTICHQIAKTPALFKASARAFGKFARLLEGYPAATLHETIENFHHTPTRYKNLMRAVEADVMGRAKNCAAEIEFARQREADCSRLSDLLEAGEMPLRVTHNDTKLNNILMDPVRDEGVCVIDLDTVMPGLLVHDFGDSIRYGANNAKEDEKDIALVNFSLPLFETYTEGFLETAGETMNRLEKEMMPWGARLMTLECGLRFLTDYLQGDVYFRVAHPSHNLDRCRTQFKLVEDMENEWDNMNRIVQKIAKL